jgi:hypothetical protein
LWEKEWEAECQWALYRINEMMDLLSDNNQNWAYHHFGAPCHCVSLFSYLQEITETDLMPRTLERKTV